MQTVFAPGCALMLYKPELAEKIHAFLRAHVAGMPLYTACCHDGCSLPDGARIIDCCPGCHRRFPIKNPAVRTVSLWEVLADSDTFPFPDYGGAEMTIHDACPTRTHPQVHTAVRALLKRMNIRLTEPEFTRTQQKCCGDSAYPTRPLHEVYAKMKERAGEMPVQDVVVYCVSCVKSMAVGGKTPRYLVDLLFGEPTVPGACAVDEWHRELDAYRGAMG